MRLASVNRELRSWSDSQGDELWDDVWLSLNSVMVDNEVGWADGDWLRLQWLSHSQPSTSLLRTCASSLQRSQSCAVVHFLTLIPLTSIAEVKPSWCRDRSCTAATTQHIAMGNGADASVCAAAACGAAASYTHPTALDGAATGPVHELPGPDAGRMGPYRGRAAPAAGGLAAPPLAHDCRLGQLPLGPALRGASDDALSALVLLAQRSSHCRGPLVCGLFIVASGALPRLQKLRIDGGLRTRVPSLPDTMSRHTMLRHLEVQHVRIADTCEVVRALTALTWLDLRWGDGLPEDAPDLPNPLPTGIDALRGLRELRVTCNNKADAVTNAAGVANTTGSCALHQRRGALCAKACSVAPQ